MPYEQGLSDWRVYAAEQSVGYDEPLEGIAACQDFVDELTSSSWWGQRFGLTPPISVAAGGHEHLDLGLAGSHATPIGHPRPERWVISMHPGMMRRRILIHELAHCAAPLFVAEDIGPHRRNGQLLAIGHREHLQHGPHFARTLAEITGYALLGDAGELADALTHFEAPVATVAELVAELQAQPAIYDEEAELLAEAREFFQERAAERRQIEPSAAQPAARGWVPTISWGTHFKMMRREAHRRLGGPILSQRLLAAEISRVTPCSASHIARLDHAEELPRDVEQLRRAMLATIYMGIDPMWTRYNMRLTRWDCGDITLDQARTLNPRWADLVERMNAQLLERPARWTVHGRR